MEKTLNWTFAGLKSIHQGPRIYFVWNPKIEGHRIHHIGSLAKSARSRPTRLSCLADRSFGRQSRISNKIYSDPWCMLLVHPVKVCWKSFQYYSKSTQRTVKSQKHFFNSFTKVSSFFLTLFHTIISKSFLSEMNDWIFMLDKHMVRTYEKIMATCFGTGNGKKQEKNMRWEMMTIFLDLRIIISNLIIVHTTIYTTLSIKTITV